MVLEITLSFRNRRSAHRACSGGAPDNRQLDRMRADTFARAMAISEMRTMLRSLTNDYGLMAYEPLQLSDKQCKPLQ
jgi:hypothetical protein